MGAKDASTGSSASADGLARAANQGSASQESLDRPRVDREPGNLGEAPRTEEALRRLAAGIAHDLGNILTVIQGFSELLQLQHGQMAALADGLQEIVEGSNRAGELINDLLIVGQRQVIAPVPLDLNEAIERLMPFCQSHLQGSVLIERRYGPCPLMVLFDPAGLECILVSLCLQAKAGMPQGGTVTIETCRLEPDAAFRRTRPWSRGCAYARVRVRDTGAPFDAAHLPHLFEPFYARQLLRRGSGLGLALVWGWMRVHQGAAEVETSDGGTTFSLYFPMDLTLPANSR